MSVCGTIEAKSMPFAGPIRCGRGLKLRLTHITRGFGPGEIYKDMRKHEPNTTRLVVIPWNCLNGVTVRQERRLCFSGFLTYCCNVDSRGPNWSKKSYFRMRTFPAFSL